MKLNIHRWRAPGTFLSSGFVINNIILGIGEQTAYQVGKVG